MKRFVAGAGVAIAAVAGYMAWPTASERPAYPPLRHEWNGEDLYLYDQGGFMVLYSSVPPLFVNGQPVVPANTLRVAFFDSITHARINAAVWDNGDSRFILRSYANLQNGIHHLPHTTEEAEAYHPTSGNPI